MLNYENTQIKLSEFRGLYDKIIPKDNILRKIKENIGFSFVNEMLNKSYCEYYGRPAKEPEMMFKLQFLKVMYDLSDEQLIENANHNMAFKFFLGLDPEDTVVDSSLLTKFRKTRIKDDDILEEMLYETVNQAISKGLIKSNAIIVDATHTRSKSKGETPTQALRRMSKNLRKVIYKQDFSISNEFPEKPSETETIEQEIEYSKNLIAVIEQRLEDQPNASIEKSLLKLKSLLKDDKIKEIQSAVDEDAKRGYKSENNSFFGYKNHIAMTEERIITAIEVTSGEAPDGKFLGELIKKTQANGVEVKEVIADTAYSDKDNLKLMNSQDIKPITKLNPIISNTVRDKDDGFEYIKDANCMRCPTGELSVLTKVKKRNSKKTNSTTLEYYFNVKKCKNCIMKNGCYNPNSKSKTYSITIMSDLHRAQKTFQETDYFKERAKNRYMIEAKNAELKQQHGLDRCKYTGLFSMRRQTFFTAFVVNAKRIIKLMEMQQV